MRPELRDRILAYNAERAADREKARDFMTLLGFLPPGQVKQLLRDETCGSILRKYGISEVTDDGS